MSGQKPGRIPWSLVRDWAAHHGYDAETFTALDHGLAVMDQVFIEHCNRVAQRGEKP